MGRCPPCREPLRSRHPIGNLEDLTLRAVRVLREVALIACEDTRRTARLLQAHQISTPTTSFFEHNERWKGERILRPAPRRRDVALVSDAGTPGISDPGFRLVRDARAEGPGRGARPGRERGGGGPLRLRASYRPLPLRGFLPARTPRAPAGPPGSGARRETLVLYEAPTRVVAPLSDMIEIWGDREAVPLPRGHEGSREIRARLPGRAARTPRRAAGGEGEVVLVVEGRGADSPPDAGPEPCTRRWPHRGSRGARR
jgi:16S rRNA (cytidine1402-2'-O)-methyltransferase